MFATLDATCPLLPTDRPRYLMGVGKPADLVGAVARGIDMFDCVLPTRSGRTAQAFTRRGTVNLKNARHADDPRPLDEESACPAARDYSRAYLHHLVRSGEILGAMLLTWNNLWYYQDLMRGLRAAIEERRLADFAAAFHDEQARGDLPPWRLSGPTGQSTATVSNSASVARGLDRSVRRLRSLAIWRARPSLRRAAPRARLRARRPGSRTPRHAASSPGRSRSASPSPRRRTGRHRRR